MKKTFYRTLSLILLTTLSSPLAFADSCQLRLQGIEVTDDDQQALLKEKNWQVVSNESAIFDAEVKAEEEIKVRRGSSLFWAVNNRARAEGTAELFIVSTGERQPFFESVTERYRWNPPRGSMCGHPSPGGATARAHSKLNQRLMDDVIDALPACEELRE